MRPSYIFVILQLLVSDFAFRKVKHKDGAFSKLGHGGKSNAEHIGNTAAKIQSYTACLHIISAVKSCVAVVENSRQPWGQSH